MLHVHRAERADGLVEALRALLADPLPDPFAPEVVAVPTRGMERWLAQRMSDRLGAGDGRGDGVCANVDFPSPRRLVGDAVATASGIEADADPWLPERAVWALLEVVDGCLGEPWLASLAAHLGGSWRRRRIRRGGLGGSARFGISRSCSIATRCIGRRWCARGRAGRTGAVRGAAGCGRRSSGGGCARGSGCPDPAERVEGACARLREEPGIVDLPARLSLFGLTRLPAGHLNVLRALAVGRDVHVFMLHPSPALWERVAERGVAVVRRRDDPTAALPANRLLASWGQDSREMQLVLGGVRARRPSPRRRARGRARCSRTCRPTCGPTGGRPARRCPAKRTRGPCWTRATAASQVHACHGRARQVEVLRDAILHLLDEDPTLEPRDVIVMCPDIETFAPLIQATFGAGEVFEDDDELEALPADVRPPDLRVRLADRSLRQTNPVLGVVARLLDLVDERLTASQVLDFADQEPVRRRFGLDDDDLARIEDWVAASGIRWGLDAAHRAPFKLDALAAGTWRAGRRPAAGRRDDDRGRAAAVPRRPPARRRRQRRDRRRGALRRARRSAAATRSTRSARPRRSTPGPTAIADAADALTTTSERDAWQRAELDRLLGDVVDEAAGSGSATSLAPAEVRALLAERLKGRPTRANFRTGHLTICTLMPMRSVPHRVVCLLGMDDGVFPRKSPRDGDDLMLADPHVGERDAAHRGPPAAARRAARRHRPADRHLHRQRRAHEPRPSRPRCRSASCSTSSTARCAPTTGPARERVEMRHPLQPFDPQELHRRRAHARARRGASTPSRSTARGR